MRGGDAKGSQRTRAAGQAGRRRARQTISRAPRRRDPGPTVREPLSALRELRSLGEPRALAGHPQLVLLYERIYAACMDRLLASPPTHAMIGAWAAFTGQAAPQAEAAATLMELIDQAQKRAKREDG